MITYIDDTIKRFPFKNVRWPLLKEFIKDKLEHYPLSSKKRYYKHLNRFGKAIGYNKAFSKSDVIDYLHSPYFLNLSVYTQNAIKTCLRQLLKWLHREYDYIKNKRIKRLELKLSTLPTWDELRRVIAQIKRPRDKAIFILFLETGAMSKEIEQLNIGDLTFQRKIATVNFKRSKFLAPRTLPLIESVPFLLSYLEIHPFKDDPQAPLFLSYFKGHYNRLRSPTFNYIINRDTKNLNKKVYPLLLRKMRLRQLSRLVMPPILESFAGWVPESEMSHYYYSPTDKEVEQKILDLYGIPTSSRETPCHIVGIKECPICNHLNSRLDNVCRKCTSNIEK